MSAVVLSAEEFPLALRQSPELLPTMVPFDSTVQVSLTLPLQV